MHTLILQKSDNSSSRDLYKEAYIHACKAIQLDTSARYSEAKNAYSIVIKTLQKLIQKLNEYKHRIEQLERYLGGIKPTRKNTSIYINENSPYQSRRDLFETDIERSIQDEWMEKAKFSFDQAELNEEKGNTEHALDYYSDAAELYLKAFKEYPNDTEEKLYARQEFMKAIDKAEQLKAQQQKATQFLSPRTRSSSSVSSTMDQLSNGSRRRSSSTSIQQQPTDDVMTQKLSASEIEVLKHTSSVNNNTFLPWIDETDLKEQFSYPTKFLDPMGSLALSEKQQEKFGGWKRPCDIMRHPKLICCISSTSIIQDIVTDCSFVASLCVAAAYEQKFKKQLITSCIYPQNKQGLPCYNPNGKYVVKLVYNGIARKVVVDDLLPVSREGTLMCTFSTTKGELWASIIEKAYMKLMGGYDFPGSNSGIDLHCLTGWIPEHIFIHDKYFVPDNVWDRILDGMKYGDVLVTIATGDMTEEEASRLGLVPTHAYAVIDITMIHGKRLLQVKNPWSHKRWRGPYSHLDSNIWTAELREALSFDPDAAEENDDGIFWIDYESVCTHFTSIHLNWNPELFTHRWVLHSVWPEHVGPKKDVYSLAYNPQFSLKVNVPDKKPAAVWLLLSKHIMVTEENTDYITLHVYSDTGGERVYYPDHPFKEGTYVNSPHILVRFNAPPGESDYTIVVSQHEKERSLYFSIRAYSLAPFKLHEVPIKYSVEKKWKLTIPPTSNAELLLMLEAPKGFAIHLLLVEGGKRASSVSVRDILAESGPYRHGFCYCQLDHIRQPIPLEGAGMFKKVIHGEWIVGYNAMGCPSFGNYKSVPSMNVTIYEKHPTELFGKEVATSGPYTNVTQGVATNEVVLSQSETGYIIVLATHDKDVAGEFTAIVYSDRPVNVTKDR
ncbi:cysteine proteinase [Rhizopus microsporus]|uniref:Cysteine proteinase n=1 Tax=Rhizopus microsporus TaxID=58291 RepID=A0A1X0SFL2_RHIZD|nr:cysteine proteinase [Rhizopus microsporus]